VLDATASDVVLELIVPEYKTLDAEEEKEEQSTTINFLHDASFVVIVFQSFSHATNYPPFCKQ
jgi:hypothetical protein